ncbi:MAG: hypothetical protein K2G39_13295, partial [Lachnospiraceae bacterium]|nr:hypothetical protein [Lachnospiraceae bacterium]
VKQDTNIQKNANTQKNPFMPFDVDMAHTGRKKVVCQNTDNQNNKIIDVIISIKPHRHSGQKSQCGFVLTEVIQSVISN